MSDQQEQRSQAATQANVGDAAGYELAFREGVRELEHQERSLDELRSRTGTLLAVSGLVTSFLGAAALPDAKPWTCALIIAVLAFVATIAFCLIVLWPFTNWRFVNGPAKVIGDYVEGEPPATMAETYRDLALHAGTNAGHNGRRLRWLFWAFEAAAVGLIVQVLAWLTVLWGELPG